MKTKKSKQIFDHRQEKRELGITVAVKMACEKDKATAAEGQQNAQQNTAKAFLKVISLLIKNVNSH